MKRNRRRWRDSELGRILDRSLFAKFFFACVSIMLTSFIFLGTAMIVFSIGYSNNEKETLYLRNARNIASTMSALDSANPNNKNTADVAEYLVKTAFPLTAQNLEANIYICEPSGKIDYVISATIESKSSRTMIKAVMDVINQRKEICEEGTLGGFFNSTYTTAGVPILGADGHTVIGAVFVSSPGGGFIGIIRGIFNIFFFCVLFILLAAFVVIYFVTSRLVRPLRQMSSAAKSFSKGDFSARIPVDGHDEVGELSASFNNMAQSLSSLEDMRSSFVANVSHELKTPMTSIAGFIDGILDGTIPSERQDYYLKIVSDEVKRLSRLVRSFLDIARIEAGEFKINPSEFEMMELVRRIVIGFEKQISEKSLEIRGLDNESSYKVFADFDLTYQIVYNLIDNAVKFANEGGFIEIHVAAKSKKVFVSVKNSGMGIPSSELPYVFDRFYKTDKSRSRDRKGVGLGLYIVKTVLNMQQQDIVVKSVEGEYCEFVFTLKEI